jgi:hypothetical protein
MAVKQEQKMTLGPILQKSVRTIIPLAKKTYGYPIDEKVEVDDMDFAYWLSHEAIPEHVPADDKDIPKLLRDTPDVLAYCIPFDDLYRWKR